MTHTFKPSPVHGAGATLFMNEHCSDITIIITEDCTVWRFPAHSTVLAAQSIVFHRMLDSDFIEKKTQEIVLQDMTPSTLKKLLRYMYLGDAILEDWKEAIELLKAAHKYQMESLVQKCAHFLQEHIDLSNVCYIYSKAVTYTLSPLGTTMTHTFKPSPVHGAGATLFMNEHCSDITIIITEDCTVWRFPAHSTVLAAQSIVFHRMLDSDFIEKKTQEIVLQDMTPSTLKKLLRYMYLGDAILEDWKEAIELLKAAHKYQMESLVQKCAHFLQEHIDLSNVCYIYSKAVTYTLSPLGNICLEIILGTGCIVLRSQGFEYLNKESVMAVISSYSLNVDGEMCVVNALLRWAVMECCRQNKPLTEESIVEIMVPFRKYLCTRSINSDEMHTLPHFLHAEINSYHSRQSFCVTQHLLDYAKRVSLQLIDLDCLADNVSNFTCFRFLADHSLFLISVHLVTVTSFLTSNNYVVLVSESGNSNTPVFELNLAEVTEITTSLPGASSKPMFETEVLLKKPVLLQPQTVYRLSLRSNSRSLKPSQCHIQFPKTGLVPSKVGSRSDVVPFTILTDSIWGVTKLMYLTAPVPEKEIFKFRLQK